MTPHPVHPRLRGELSIIAIVLDIVVGSSPLTRGTRLISCQARSKSRFIPAYAGNSYSLQIEEPSIAVHPRLRGELDQGGGIGVETNGSSPLTRGTRPRHVVRFCASRFIPAYAGNSNEKAGNSRFPAVHPRLRGELWLAESVHRQFNGSSPLTRGTRVMNHSE